jgi:hypothetical protein
MKNYREVLNEQTGEIEFHFSGKLIQISEKTLENSNGNQYKVVLINFDLPSGENVDRTAICYESNYNHGVEIGKDYLCTVNFTSDGQPYLRMSHLSIEGRASVEDFSDLYQLTMKLENSLLEV